jgi:hypothetical protein
MHKIYLDVCSLNRPFDDQTQMKIRLETEAKLFIQAGIRDNKYSLVWSYMLDYENDKNPYEDKRRTISPWKNISKDYCTSSDDVLNRAKEIMKLDIKGNDALHIACAIEKKCSYFITTDNKLTNKNVDGIVIINPINFVLETEN